MKLISRLPEPDELYRKYPISEERKQERKQVLCEINDVLKGKSNKKLLIIGPCSADREDAVLDYAHRLIKIKNILQEKYIVIPRIYTSKPRTNGKGYKGLIHRPEAESKKDDMLDGIIAMRKIHQRVINETGLFPSDELLYPETYPYVQDLLVYMAVGARSVEDQQHRLIASGMDIPVGMKNPTSGNLTVMLNAITAAQASQSLLFSGWIAETKGNPYSHAIIRGYVDSTGRNRANYHYEDLCFLYDKYIKSNLLNPSVIVDCNHSNSDKKYEEQLRIVEDVLVSCKKNRSIDRFVKGFMVESYIEDGNQMIGEGIYGKSITDACIGWEKTVELMEILKDYA